MKTRSSSPQSSPAVVRRYRVDSFDGTMAKSPSQRSPSLRVEQLPTIAMNGFHPFGTPSASRDVSPSLISTLPSSLRKVSPNNSPSASPSKSSSTTTTSTLLNGHSTPSPASLTTTRPENDSPSVPSTPWSSAVGHATTAGKSGRVIERLMAENDRLKRELELSLLKVQELERSAQTYKPQLDAMREKIDSLSHVRDMDSSLISRRDRKIEEQKQDLAVERQDKMDMQKRMREVERSAEEARERFARESQGLVESTRHATVHAEILETSHRQLSAEYRARREAWERDLRELHEEREGDRQRMARLDVVYEQMRQEGERTRRVQTEMAARWEEIERGLRVQLEEGEAANEVVRVKGAEMAEVVDKMRWVMGLQKMREKEGT